MNKVILLFATFFTTLITPSVYSQPVDGGYPCAEQCDDGWCLCVEYEPCYYTTRECIEERVPITKRCCRKVPRYHEVQRCRYIPEYYTEMVCTVENEYYDVEVTKLCKRWVCGKKCRYEPKYTWKYADPCQTPAYYPENVGRQ